MQKQNSIDDLIDYSPEVQKAFANKSPLVALESTIITHGNK